jgi:uncharacterized cysteine cluster protein YcgN (CxxCxxCC family)
LKTTAPFWKTKTLDQMTRSEWESLCDGCGKCCLHKLEDAETGKITYTYVACRLLDFKTIRCQNYEKRHKFVPDCSILTPSNVGDFNWLPKTCAYRRLYDGEGLAPWHPLITGDPLSVHKAGISIKGKFITENEAGDLEDHIAKPEDGFE